MSTLAWVGIGCGIAVVLTLVFSLQAMFRKSYRWRMMDKLKTVDPDGYAEIVDDMLAEYNIDLNDMSDDERNDVDQYLDKMFVQGGLY